MRGVATFTTNQVTLTTANTAAQIVAANVNRTRITLISTEGDLWLGTSTVTRGGGFLYPAGVPVVFETQSEIWGISSDANVKVQYAEEAT